MIATEKKAIEKEYLLHFLKLYEDRPRGKIISSESPDFIISLNRKRSIGIELTKLIVDHSVSQKHLSREDLNTVIEKKNRKLKLYRKKRIDLYWLIIIIEDETAETIIHQHTAQWDFITSFNKIFLFYPERKQLMEVV